MNLPSVSVIVPLFNREKFLPQLFKTLDDQSYKDFEVILVDDGSTDNSQQWLADHSLKYGQTITFLQQKNAGPYVARNYGLSVAKGSYIAFQDSDDEWPSYHLAEFVEAMTKNPDVDWLFGSLTRINHETREVVEQTNFVKPNGQRHPFISLTVELRDNINVIIDPGIKQSAIEHCVPGSTQCALIRRSVFKMNQFDPTYRTAYDRFFAIKTVMRGHKFGYVDKTHQIYHIHDAHISLVAGVNPEKLRNSAETMLRGYSSLLTLAENNNEISAIKKQLARVNAWELSIALKDLGLFKESSNAMRKALFLEPLNWRYIKSYLVSLFRLIFSVRSMK